jgi:predicted nucleic-acid-binding protein
MAGLPTITVEEPARLAQAMGWMRQGMDFADGLHLAKADSCTMFLSFDQTLARLAKASDSTPVEAP